MTEKNLRMNRLGNLQKFINLQSNVPVMHAHNQLLKGEYNQMVGAQKGAGIGSLAQLAMMAYMMG